MTNPLTTREIALVVWAVAFSGWAATRRDVRGALGGVVRAASNWKLLVSFTVVAGYAALEVAVLSAIGFWTADLLKDTVIWILFSGIALAFSGVQQGSGVANWRRVLRRQLTAVVMVEYVVNTYTFALWIELLLVPVLVFVLLLDATARTDAKYAPVTKITGALQAVFGITVLMVATYQAILGRDSFSVGGALREISLAPLLSALLLPIVFVFCLISAYEQLFLGLKLGPKKDSSVVWYAKWRLAARLGFRPKAVRAYARNHAVELMHATTKADVDELVRRT